MRSFRSKPVGWQHESYRHALAARGIESNYYARKSKLRVPFRPTILTRYKNVPIKAHRIEVGKVYPLTPGEVGRFINRQKDDDLKGLAGVEFVNPKGDQKGAYAQYVRSRRVILIFSQPYDKKKKEIDGQSPKWIKNHLNNYVLPHELGHHIALYRVGITDGDLAMAEARADANVVGMSPVDRDVGLLKQ